MSHCKHIGICFAQDYEFNGGYPTLETVQKAYDDADLARAIQAYKFFYPTVSFEGTWRGNLKEGAVANSVFPLLEGSPRQLVFTPNSDLCGIAARFDHRTYRHRDFARTDHGRGGRPQPALGSDLGLPGLDAGRGGKHLLVGPEYKGKIPNTYYVAKATTNRVLVLLRAIPPAGNNDVANALIQTAKVYPLGRAADWKAPTWVKLPKGDFTPLQWEANFQYWQVLKEIIDLEPAYEAYRSTSVWPPRHCAGERAGGPCRSFLRRRAVSRRRERSQGPRDFSSPWSAFNTQGFRRSAGSRDRSGPPALSRLRTDVGGREAGGAS